MPEKNHCNKPARQHHDAFTSSSRTSVAYSEANRCRVSNLSPCSILPSWPFHWLYLILSPRPQRAMSITIYSPVAPPLPCANSVKFSGRRAKRSSNVLLLRGRAHVNTEVLPKHGFALSLIKSGTDTLFFMMCSSPCTEGSEFTRCLSYLSEQGKTNDVPSVSDELNNTSALNDLSKVYSFNQGPAVLRQKTWSWFNIHIIVPQ